MTPRQDKKNAAGLSREDIEDIAEAILEEVKREAAVPWEKVRQ